MEDIFILSDFISEDIGLYTLNNNNNKQSCYIQLYGTYGCPLVFVILPEFAVYYFDSVNIR